MIGTPSSSTAGVLGYCACNTGNTAGGMNDQSSLFSLLSTARSAAFVLFGNGARLKACRKPSTVEVYRTLGRASAAISVAKFSYDSSRNSSDGRPGTAVGTEW